MSCRLTQGDVGHADAQEPAAAAGPGAVQAGARQRSRQVAAHARRRRRRQAARLRARRQEVAHREYLYITIRYHSTVIEPNGVKQIER